MAVLNVPWCLQYISLHFCALSFFIARLEDDKFSGLNSRSGIRIAVHVTSLSLLHSLCAIDSP